MPISIDWATFVIYVPKDYMRLVQSIPVEVRELNIDRFRLDLKSIEDDVDGMVFPTTHHHYPAINISGVQLAKVVEILEPYTITFEDGQYAVNLVGANSNIADRTNVNQVSVRSANSAGLVQTRELEYASFQNAVWVSSVGVSGTAYPSGTPAYPVNNISDALFIANLRGFKTLKFVGAFTFGPSVTIQNMVLEGVDKSSSVLTFEPGSLTPFCVIKNATVFGEVAGVVGFYDSVIIDLVGSDIVPSSVAMMVSNCLLSGCIKIANNYSGVITLVNSYTKNSLVCDLNFSSATIVARNFSGDVIIKNGNSNNFDINLVSGRVALEDSVSSGVVVRISGVGTLENYSQAQVFTDGLINRYNISGAVYDAVGEEIQYAAFDGCVSVSHLGVAGTAYPIGTPKMPVNNLADAVSIAQARGFKRLKFLSDWVFMSNTYLYDFDIIGVDKMATHLTFQPGCAFPLCRVMNAYVSGSETGIILFDSCVLDSVGSVGLVPSAVNVNVINCILRGETILPANYSGRLSLVNCFSQYESSGNMFILNHGHSRADVDCYNLSGSLLLKNISENVKIRLCLTSGSIELDSTVTAGNIVISGTGGFKNRSNVSVDMEGFMNVETLTKVIWSAVYLDTSSTYSGVNFPIGTQRYPVNNLEDALKIAEDNLINTIVFIGNIVLHRPLSKIKFIGYGDLLSSIDVNNQHLDIVIFENCVVTGILNAERTTNSGGWIRSVAQVAFADSRLFNVVNLEGLAANCTIEGTTVMANGGWFSSIHTVIEGDFTVFDMVHSDAAVSMDIDSGYARFVNAGDGSLVELNVKGGEVELDASCIGGAYYIEGVGTLYNSSSMEKKDDHLIWDEDRGYIDKAGSIGRYIKNQLSLNDVILGK